MITVAAAVIFDGNGKVLLSSRPEGKPPVGWEFPGGKVEPGETVAEALKRELLEELDLEGECGSELSVVTAPPVELHFLIFTLSPGSIIRPREGQQFRWQNVHTDMPSDLLPNDRPVWELLKKMGNN